ANRCQLVFGLDDRVARLAGVRIVAIPAAVAAEGLSQRRRGGDGVPGGDGRPAVDAAQSRRAVAFEKDLVAYRGGALNLEPDRGQIAGGVVAPHVQRLDVGLE